MKVGAWLFYSLASALGAVAGCSGLDAASEGGASSGVPGPSGSGGSGLAANPGGMAGSSSLAPEQELDQAFKVPVVSGRWVWTANPVSGLVALIDAESYVVKTVEAGAGPTYLTALPAPRAGGSRALVINAVSEDATLLTASPSGELESSAPLELHAGANAWAVSPDGRFAIAWSNASAAKNPDPSQGFQDITVLDLTGKTPSSKRLSVGFRPARVFMDDDNRYAYVVTEPGIDVIDLQSSDGPSVEREVELSTNPANDTAKRDVNLTPDGKLAFVSRVGKDYVTVVDVEQGAFKDIQLPGVVTDLDLSADASMAVAIVRQPTLAVVPPARVGGEGGQAGEAATSGGGDAAGGTMGVAGASGAGELGMGGAGELAGGGGAAGQGPLGEGGAGPGPVVPAHSLAVLLPAASIFSDPTLFDIVKIDELFGSVELGQNGATALLYLNGAPNSHLTLLGLQAGAGYKQHRTVDVKLPVFSVVSAPDGAHALALLKPPAGSARPGAFAVVPIAQDLPSRIEGTVAATVPDELGLLDPAMVAIDDTRALVTVTNRADQHVAYLVRMPELVIDAVPLASVPLPQASGIVRAANKAFVAQRHPEGRITFIDLETAESHTLTGFELSSRVSDAN